MDEQTQPPKFRIGAVARMTRLSTHQLRVWERRYGVVTPERSEGGGRLYSSADVERLRRIKQLTDTGHAVGRLARLADAELDALQREHAAGAPALLEQATAAAARERFFEAIEAMSPLSAERELSRAAMGLAPDEFLARILVPLLHEVGDRWARGVWSVAHEHAASAAVRNQLGALLQLYSAQASPRRAIVATLSRELHELGALSAALTAATHGFHVAYLGPNLPIAEIAGSVNGSRADVLLLSIVCDRPALDRELEELRAKVRAQTCIMLGGNGARRARDIAGIEKLASLEALALRLTERQREAAEGP